MAPSLLASPILEGRPCLSYLFDPRVTFFHFSVSDEKVEIGRLEEELERTRLRLAEIEERGGGVQGMGNMSAQAWQDQVIKQWQRLLQMD